MKMGGQVGSQCWDTAFSVAAFCETGLAGEFKGTLIKAADFIDKMQMRANMPNRERYIHFIIQCLVIFFFN